MLDQPVAEPAYVLERKLDQIEIRQYAPYVVAEVHVAGPADEAGQQAFPILAGYIFGKNLGARKFAMTAPVTQVAKPVSMAMTAPVSQIPTNGADGGFVVQFVLPRGVSLESAPEPIDPRVQVRQMPAQRLAAIVFSGFWSESNYNSHLAQLREALTAAQLTWTGEPVYSRYNPPYTLWFLRRNEIWLSVPDK